MIMTVVMIVMVMMVTVMILLMIITMLVTMTVIVIMQLMIIIYNACDDDGYGDDAVDDETGYAYDDDESIISLAY